MRVYLDHAATTPLNTDVLNAMMPYLTTGFGNANSLHSFGRENHAAVENSRKEIAEIIGCKPQEIYFTSGGTESDNWALRGLCGIKGKHIITSQIEHPAIMATCSQLSKQGVKITYLPVDSYGLVNPDELEKAITPDTSLVSIMLANNEVGTIEPIKELSAIAKKHGVVFHTDAVQAVGNIPVNVADLGVDLMSFSAHKFYGPKGIGVLYIRSGLRLEKLITGGHQERTMRGGTTNVASVVGMAKALKIASVGMDKRNEHIRFLRDRLVSKISEIPHIRYNGHEVNRLPSNANFSFEFIEGESILMLLDMQGIACSSGSACSSASLEPSHVLLSMGVPIEVAHGSIRFSLGQGNTVEEIDYTAECVRKVVDRLRQMSPLYLEIKGEGTPV